MLQPARTHLCSRSGESTTDAESQLALLFVNEEKRKTLMLEPGQKGASCKPDLDRPNVLVQILKDWSTQCFKIFTQPGVDTLAKEGENASWGRSGLLLLLFYLLALLADQLSASPLDGRSFLRSPLGYLVVVFCNFFIWMGLVYLLARLLRGRGRFLAQCYVLLFPLILTSLLSCLLISLHAFLALPSLLLVVLQYVVQPVLLCSLGTLSVRALMAVHRLSWGKASMVFLSAGLTFFLLSFLPGNPFQF